MLATIEGLAAPYDVWGNVGDYDEVFRSGAFDGVIGAAVPLLINHDRRQIITYGACLRLGKRGLYVSAFLPWSAAIPSRRAVLELMDGTASGLSISFTCRRDDWAMGFDGRRKRIVKAVQKIFEVSLIIPPEMPAYRSTFAVLRREAA